MTIGIPKCYELIQMPITIQYQSLVTLIKAYPLLFPRPESSIHVARHFSLNHPYQFLINHRLSSQKLLPDRAHLEALHEYSYWSLISFRQICPVWYWLRLTIYFFSFCARSIVRRLHRWWQLEWGLYLILSREMSLTPLHYQSPIGSNFQQNPNPLYYLYPLVFDLLDLAPMCYHLTYRCPEQLQVHLLWHKLGHAWEIPTKLLNLFHRNHKSRLADRSRWILRVWAGLLIISIRLQYPSQSIPNTTPA